MSIKHLATYVAGGTAAAAAAAVLLVAPANAEDAFVVIAYDDRTGQSIKAGGPTYAEAEAAARNVLPFMNGWTISQKCVALVSHLGNMMTGEGPSTEAAIARANSQLPAAGSVLQSACASNNAPPRDTGLRAVRVNADVDYYDGPNVPDGAATKLGFLQQGDQVELMSCRVDGPTAGWCVVKGKGWLWGEFLDK
jgi:hypothetical protein